MTVDNPFPEEFVNGPDIRSLGDTHPDDSPQSWWNGQFVTSDIHGSLHIYSTSIDAAEESLVAVRSKMAELGIAELNPNGQHVKPLAGHVLLDHRRVHFGYVDGISQPDVDWENESPAPGRVDRRHFLLGYDGTIPTAPSFARTGILFQNCSYLAFRWLQQDVPAFEQFLTDNADRVASLFPGATDPRELLAAKLIGRWRSGVSLVEAPLNDSSADSPNNAFGYAGPDPDGLKCPFSAHARVTNPRDQKLAAIVREVPRILRRGMPYGPEWQPGVNDEADRGLFGLFICGSLERQFQMLTRWMNVNDFSPVFDADIPLGQDPLFGARGVSAERPPFRIPVPGGILQIPLPSKPFVRSRGTAYLLIPSVSTLDRVLAEPS